MKSLSLSLTTSHPSTVYLYCIPYAYCMYKYILFVAYSELKQLLQEFRDKHYPETSLSRNLVKACRDAERCACLGMSSPSQFSQTPSPLPAPNLIITPRARARTHARTRSHTGLVGPVTHRVGRSGHTQGWSVRPHTGLVGPVTHWVGPVTHRVGRSGHTLG